MTKRHAVAAAVLAWLLPAGLLTAAPGAGATPTVAPRPSAAGDSGDVRSYWTPQRMRDAVPVDRSADGATGATGAGPTARRTTAGAQARAVVAPRSTGKLFFSDGASDYVCSGAAVNTPERNVVLTAGHCVNSGATRGLLGCRPGRYFTRFLFVPGYAGGARPYGAWTGVTALAQPDWVNQCGNYSHDQAVLTVAPLGGRRLVDVVGGNAVAWGYPQREDGVRVIGWPAEAPYDGESAQQCTGSTSAFPETGDAHLACPLNGGASGGPWFLTMTSVDVGFIWAVTSRRTTEGPPILLAWPLDRTILTLLAAVRSPAARAASPAQPAVSARGRGPLAVAAVPAVTGRGQPYRLRLRARPGTKVVVQVRRSASARWARLGAVRIPASGVVELTRAATPVGPTWFRLKQGKRVGKKAKVVVRACPLPADRSGAVVAATGCTSPTA
ncbi:trypsin-like serine peptidase [Pimelobacter simplex]|uniref:trypsin-like serine peptidase n=1 Tax=Nocardioides simplex TaxID=2045 RepID=UPI0021501FF0|nr:hypothetical protein [Pimelobacter simplex]UUW88250.1 hypothetical protein M0M43_21245 [Pimelobacter simplex]UUW97755.1 hypothetical protein M0M48_09890 [Pimelobacter simplex]